MWQNIVCRMRHIIPQRARCVLLYIRRRCSTHSIHGEWDQNSSFIHCSVVVSTNMACAPLPLLCCYQHYLGDALSYRTSAASYLSVQLTTVQWYPSKEKCCLRRKYFKCLHKTNVIVLTIHSTIKRCIRHFFGTTIILVSLFAYGIYLQAEALHATSVRQLENK